MKMSIINTGANVNPALLEDTVIHVSSSVALSTRNAFCGTWYLPHSHVHVHNERTVPILSLIHI